MVEPERLGRLGGLVELLARLTDVDGDADDLRFLDPRGDRGFVIGLRFKAGQNRQGGIDRSEGFVVRV